jgi:hypothetical protein
MSFIEFLKEKIEPSATSYSKNKNIKFEWVGQLHDKNETDEWNKDSFFQITINAYIKNNHIGYVTIFKNHYKTEIKFIRIFDKYKRLGYAEELIQQLISKNIPDGIVHSYKQIKWGYTTSDGKLLKQTLDKKLK